MLSNGVNVSERAFSWGLQKWIFKKHIKRYDNYCPYFWLTIFCMSVAAPVGIFRLIAFPFSKLANLVVTFIDIDNRNVTSVNQWLDRASNVEMYDLYMLMWRSHVAFYGRYEYERYYSFYYSCWVEWKSRLDNDISIDEHVKQYVQEWNEAQEKRRIAIEKSSERKERNFIRMNNLFNTIIRFTKPIAKFSLVVLSGVVGWVLGTLIMFIIVNITLDTAMLILACAGAITIGVGVILGSEILIGSNFIERLGKRVSDVFTFFGSYIKAAKENYCPKINWTD